MRRPWCAGRLRRACGSASHQHFQLGGREQRFDIMTSEWLFGHGAEDARVAGGNLLHLLDAYLGSIAIEIELYLPGKGIAVEFRPQSVMRPFKTPGSEDFYIRNRFQAAKYMKMGVVENRLE